MKDSFNDEMAMNWIADLIRDNRFDPDAIERICEILKLAGREILESFEA
jgi:hypothetical protein